MPGTYPAPLNLSEFLVDSPFGRQPVTPPPIACGKSVPLSLP